MVDSSFFYKHFSTVTTYSINKYDCFLKGVRSRTWLGHVFYLSSSLFALNQTLINIFETIRLYFYPSAPKVLQKSVSVLSPVFSDELKKFDVDGKLGAQTTDKALEEGQPYSSPSDAYPNELAAKKVQSELCNKIFIKNQTSTLQDDESLARKLQEEINAELVNEEIFDPDFYGSVGTNLNSSPSFATLTVEDSILKEWEQKKKIENATYTILTTSPALIHFPKPEDPKDPNSKQLPFYVLQGEALLSVVAALTKEYPQALSSAALRSQREANFELYLAFKLKQFAHIQELKGAVQLPGGKFIGLEGSFDVLAAPPVISSYDSYSKTSKFFNLKDREWIISQFNKIFFCDYVSLSEIPGIVLKLQTPENYEPLVLATGFSDHCAGVICIGDHWLYADRGGINAQSGINVFYLPNRELITEEFISDLIKIEEIEEENYQMQENIVSLLGANLVHYEYLPGQKVGNCTHATMEAILKALMASRILLNDKGGKLKNVSSIDWKNAFDKVHSEFMRWLDYEKKENFDDMVSEIEEWLTHTTIIGQLDLKKTYVDLLSSWLVTPDLQRETAAINQVTTLLEALSQDNTHEELT